MDSFLLVADPSNLVTQSGGKILLGSSGDSLLVSLPVFLITETDGKIIIGEDATQTVGGHFIPLTKKQIQEAEKRARKVRKAAAAAQDSKRIDASHIAADMREIMHPSPKIDIMSLQDDDDDEDLEFILLNS